MTTYILIDNESGYVWGVTDAQNAIEACKKVDRRNKESAREYVQDWGRNCVNETGYHVYYGNNFDHSKYDDGTNPDFIAAVKGLAFVAYVRVLS
jgi:hypothetical protein